MGGDKLLGLWLTRDRDELHEQMRHGCCSESDRLREENARLRGYMRPDQIEEAETVTKLIRERDEARAEVARLEGLILDWEENDVVDLDPLGDEARRIRAQREEGTWEGPNGASLRDLYGREEGK